MIARFLDADSSLKRIITGICCIKAYCKNFPRDLIFKIFTEDRDLLKDFALMLILASFDFQKRMPSVSITNTTAWRLLITYMKNGIMGKIVIGPDEKVSLDELSDGFSSCQATCYGETWNKVTWTCLDLAPELRQYASGNPNCDIDIHIDGGQGFARQFTRPFRVTYHAHRMVLYDRVSLVPESRMLVDAFPLVKYKLSVKKLYDARCFLQLPS